MSTGSVEGFVPQVESPLGEEELWEAGRAARREVPRSSHAEYVPAPGRDPLGILMSQHRSRLERFIKLRVERMSADAFAFYRGTAAIQAADLAFTPSSGAEVVLCGDAHLANFGIYRSPEKTMVFDINDFDEANPGPWEWDLKRLLASVELGGRALGIAEDDLHAIVENAGAMYRNSLRNALSMPLLDRYFTPTQMMHRQLLSADSERMIKQTMKESEKRTSERVAARSLEDGGDGRMRFVERPPVLLAVEPEVRELVDGVFADYRATLPPNIALLMSQYEVLDVARRVVGVGSVGTRCFILALRDPTGDVLILQLKEANLSVIEEFGGVPTLPGYYDTSMLPDHQGYRVVACQRILQAVSDPFLGYVNTSGYSFYVRMFRNRNASFDLTTMNQAQYSDYAMACGIVLARAHARSPKAAFAAGYMGTKGVFVRAVAEWAHKYADQAEADYRQFVEAADRGLFG